MPNPSTPQTPGGTTEHWRPIAKYGGIGQTQGYVSDEAVILHDIRNLLTDIRNLLIDVLRTTENK